MKNIKSLSELNLEGKRILMRVDFNVSLQGKIIADDTRIKQAIPTIKYLLEKNAGIILVSHLGRPDGKRVNKFSIAPAAHRLSLLIKKPISVVNDFTKNHEKATLLKLKPGEIKMLENIRFYPQEERNDYQFSQALASLADVYINDAFGVNHRVHSSTVGVASFLPKAAGLLLEKEIEMISKLVKKPKRPFVAIIGGAKAETKITLIDRLLEMADQLLIGGGVANTFFKAWGLEVGDSLVNHEMVELSRKLFWKALQSNTAMVLPQDVVIGSLKENKIIRVSSRENISKNGRVLDIGPHTQAEFGAIIAKAKTIVWNGPMGVYESSKFRLGTDFVYHAIAANKDAFSVVGGGDTLAALTHKHLVDEITHISTGGGSMLEYIEKGTLPAIEALKN